MALMLTAPITPQSSCCCCRKRLRPRVISSRSPAALTLAAADPRLGSVRDARLNPTDDGSCSSVLSDDLSSQTAMNSG